MEENNYPFIAFLLGREIGSWGAVNHVGQFYGLWGLVFFSYEIEIFLSLYTFIGSMEELRERLIFRVLLSVTDCLLKLPNPT